jgi:NADH dehydrogenase [ubiquinone] 1 alpha subcomplex assembly factor 7
MPDLTDRFVRLIGQTGPIPLSLFMAEANAAYYGERDPLGAEGDFTTAPEISQMFGELVGLWLADLWLRAGKPEAAYVEFGPGRGTLAADALRAMKPFGLEPAVHLVETSPALKAKQKALLPHAIWHDDVNTLPEGVALLIAANEFFDALPVRQLVKTVNGWHERLVDWQADEFVLVPGPERFDMAVPPRLRGAEPGSVIEFCPAATGIASEIAARIEAQGGAAIIIDYGYADHAQGDTLQAVRKHAYADPLAKPGTSDLTAHVDFGVLAAAARESGAKAFGPSDQGAWLEALGIGARAAALATATPERTGDIEIARRRLTHEDEMGTLFKVIGLAAERWPDAEGFR